MGVVNLESNETSPVFAYLQNPSMVDFAGHLAAVFFTTGCNFKCGFCHNAALMGRSRPGMTWGKLEVGCRQFVADWVDGAVITGGEPTLWPELPDVIRFLKDFGWAVKLDTNGSQPDRLAECLPLLDYVAMDIKAGPSGYAALTGFEDLATLKTSVAMLKADAADYEFRTTVIERFHDDTQMAEIAELVRGARRYIVQPFVPSDALPQSAYCGMSRTSAGRMDQVAALIGDCAEHVTVRGS